MKGKNVMGPRVEGRPGVVERLDVDQEKNLRHLLRATFPEGDRAADVFSQAAEIIYRNNLVAEMLNSPRFEELLQREKYSKGECKTGIIKCIDGREFLIEGRSVNVTEVAGSVLGETAEGKLDDTKFVGILSTVLEMEGYRGLLEVVTAHEASLTKKNCARAAMEDSSRPTPVVAWGLAVKNLGIIEDKVSQICKRLEVKAPDRIGVAAMVDTDTMGITLNWDKGENGLSTTKLLRDGLGKKIESLAGENIGVPGALADEFFKTEHFIDCYEAVVDLTENLLTVPGFGFIDKVDSYLKTNFSDLTRGQTQALRFVLARITAVGYFTGFYKFTDASQVPSRIGDHEEAFMAAAPIKPVGRFDPEVQAFCCSPSRTEDAPDAVMLEMGLMDHQEARKGQPRVLFISQTVNGGSDEPSLDLADLYKTLHRDERVKEQVRKGNLFIVPVLVDSDSGRIKKVCGEMTDQLSPGELLNS